jgi:transposase
MHEEPLTMLGISPEDWAATPESVQLAFRSLLDIVQLQTPQLKELQARVRDLEAKLGQTSRNSSKPPSSDPPSAPPKPPKVPRGRTAGGQVGHAGHQRPLVPPERVDTPIELLPTACPSCQHAFAPDFPSLGEPRRTQVWELPEIRPQITEYRQHSRCCPDCQQLVTADLPPDRPPGAFGPRATSLISFLRGHLSASLDATAEFLREVCNLPISPASVVTSCERASEVLAPIDAAIATIVQAAPVVNVDETGWPTETRKGWLWVAVSAVATSFRVHQSRNGPALRELLGAAYRGLVGSDRWSVYEQFPDGRRQICWAHLKRNLLSLEERYGAETRWAGHVLKLSEDLFIAWHLYREGWIDQVGLQQALIPVRAALRERLSAGTSSGYPKIASFSRELLEHWDALWTFSRVEGVEPTNNLAERALRHAVLWRKGCFGSRSAAGCRFVERMLSVRATCAQQGRSLFAFLTETIAAAWAGRPAPLLVTPPAIS